MSKKSQDSIVFQFLNEVGIIDQLARAKLESVLPDDLKMSHFIVLNHLARLDGDWSPVRLAKAFQVTKAAITNTLKRLESRGLVEVLSDPADGRGKLVRLTQAGRDMREQSISKVNPLLVDLQNNFGKNHFLTLLPMLEDIRKHLDEQRL